MATQSTQQAAAQETVTPRRGRGLIRKIALGLLLLIVGLVVLIAMQPSEFHVSRSAVMAASPEAVFEQVNNFQNWQAWSPWAKLDPNAKNTFEGPSSGEGAVFRWSGNSNVGEGSTTIVESRPGELVRIKLEFVRPMPGVSDVLFTFKPVGDQTEVTWSMSGENSFLGKAMGLLIDCEKMCGDEFNKGLASIKAIVERPSAETAAQVP